MPPPSNTPDFISQVSSEASLARERAEQLEEELDEAKEGLRRSDSNTKELQKRQAEGR